MPGIGYDYYKSKKNVTLTSRLLDPISRLGAERKLGRGENHQLRFTILTTRVFCQTKFSPSRSSEINVENKLLQFFVKENMG